MSFHLIYVECAGPPKDVTEYISNTTCVDDSFNLRPRRYFMVNKLTNNVRVCKQEIA